MIKKKFNPKKAELENMQTAGELIGITLALCENRGDISNWEFVVEKIRDIALGIAKCKELIKVNRK